jgi:hypothetical protein
LEIIIGNSPLLVRAVAARSVQTYRHLPGVTIPICRISGSVEPAASRYSQAFPEAGETFARLWRYAAMTQPDIWYVAFGPDKAVKTDDSAESAVRSTRTFKSEVDAKLFAMQILAKGWTASAGTLNPHQPKQIVAPSRIEHWADPGLGG